MNLPIIHVIAGPTASGKTDFAIKLAKEINGELINADSRQVYKYLDIGTNKGNLTHAGSDMQGRPVFFLENSKIKIHLLSFLDPDQKFSAFDFYNLAQDSIKEIQAGGKVPIIVGGSGLYLKIILDPESSFSNVKPDFKLRKDLENKSVSELQSLLPAETLKAMNNSDRHNPVRLVRQIEQLKASSDDEIQDSPAALTQTYQVNPHLMQVDWDILKSRIDLRVEQMWQAGIVEEVKQVLDQGFQPDCIGLTGSGYKYIVGYIRGKLSKETCIELVQQSHRQVAKKQITWFKKYFPVT